MKILLAIVMSTVLTGTAFAACGLSSPKECVTKETCEGLNKEGGQQFSFDEKNSVKCMTKATSQKAATDCPEVNNSSMAKTIDKDGKEGKAGATSK